MSWNRSAPKIAHVITNAWDGGIEKVVFHLCSGLSPHEFQVSVHALLDHNPGRGDFERAGIPFFSYGAENRADRHYVLKNLRAVVMLARALHRDRIDIVHVHDFFPGVLGRVAARMAAVAGCVATLHNTYDWLGRRAGLVNRVLSRRTQAVVGVSSACVQDSMARDRLPSEKYRVVYNGVDPDVFQPDRAIREAARNMLGFGPDEFVIGNIGTLSVRKGQSTLLRAFDLLTQKHPNLRLVIVGSRREHEGAVAEELRAIAAADTLSGRIRFLEGRDDVRDLLNAFDAFAMPSRQEGFGLAFVEALMCGVPCVVSDIPAFREVAGADCLALFHPVDDVQWLASQLNALITDSNLRTELSKAGRTAAVQRFSDQAMLEGWKRIYRDVLARQR